jgi:ribosomal protein S18 acetylase RimI-like enzyme
MKLAYESMSLFDLETLVDLLNRGFADYYVPVQFNPTSLLQMVVNDGTDMRSSCVVRRDAEPVAVAMIARRGWSSRLAGMAVVPEARRQGIGTWLVQKLVEEARERGERKIFLEVITKNAPAIRLYEKAGFQTLRQLLSYGGTPGTGAPEVDLTEIDLRELAHKVITWGLPDLPWQISGESLATAGPPNRAYRLGDAYVAISDPSRDRISFLSLLVAPQARGRGEGQRILRAVVAAHPDKRWGVPALCPAEVGAPFERLGLEMGPLSQYQMVLDLAPAP